MSEINSVFCLIRIDDDSVHIFSSEEKRQQYAESLDCHVVFYDYVVDEPERMYARYQ